MNELVEPPKMAARLLRVKRKKLRLALEQNTVPVHKVSRLYIRSKAANPAISLRPNVLGIPKCLWETHN
jgi:hypothetical protein